MPQPDEADGKVLETTPDGESGQDTSADEAAPQTFKVGDEDLPADQVKELVEAGRTLKKIREQYPDIDLDGLIPTFTKQTQLLKDPEKLAEYMRSKYPDRFPDKPAAGQPDELEAAMTQLAPLLSAWAKKEGLMTRADYDAERQDQAYEERVQAQEKLHDGSDGLPKFERQKVLIWGRDHGIYDPEAAYEKLYRKELTEAEFAERMKKRPKAPGTEKGGAGMQVPKNKDSAKFGSDALKKGIAETLGAGSEEE